MIARGRGRGVLKDSVPPPRVGDAFSQMSEEPLLMDIRITEIIDVCTFWAQIGTAKNLEDFDQYCVSLSAQCDDNASSSQEKPVTVGSIVPVKSGDPSTSTWQRGKITRILPNRTVEVHFLDTGKNGRVPLSDLCTDVPPLAVEMSGQALQCNLYGVEMKESTRDKGVARLQELVSLSRPHGMKTVIHSVLDEVFFLTVYTLHDGHWMSLGEILRMEEFVSYQTIPPGPLVVDHMISEPLPPHKDTPPLEYDSDSSTLLGEATLPLSGFKVDGQSHSNSATASTPAAQDSRSSFKETESIWLTPPPEVDTESDETQGLSASQGHLPDMLDLFEAHSDVQPVTPAETPPNETESYLDVSLPPLVSSRRLSPRKLPVSGSKEKHFKYSKPAMPILSLSVTSPRTERIVSPRSPPTLDKQQSELVMSPSVSGSGGLLSEVKSVPSSDDLISFEDVVSTNELSVQVSSTEATEPGSDGLPCKRENSLGVFDAEGPTSDSPAVPDRDSCSDESGEGSEEAQVSPSNEDVGDSSAPEGPLGQGPSDRTESCDQLSPDPSSSSKESGNAKQKSKQPEVTWSARIRQGRRVLSFEDKSGGDVSKSKPEDSSSTVSPPAPEQESGRPNQAEESSPEVEVISDKKSETSSEKHLSGETSGSEDEWDESLLPPRQDSTAGSKGGTPVTTPQSSPEKDSEGGKQLERPSNKKRFKAQYEALMNSSENWEPPNRGKGNWSKNKKFNRRSFSSGQLYSDQPWPHDQFFGAPRPRPPCNGQYPPRNRAALAGRGMARGRGVRGGRDDPYNPQPPNPFQSEQMFYEEHPPFRGGWSTEPPHPFMPPRGEPTPSVEESNPQAGRRKLEPLSQSAPEAPAQNGPPKIEMAQLSPKAEENEYQWHTWMIQVKIKKMIGDLSKENVKEFGQQICELLSDHSAKVLVALKRGKPPLTVALESVLDQVTEVKKDELIVEAIAGVVKSLSDPMVYKVLQDAVCAAAKEVSTGSTAQRRRQSFCSFVRKLFISATYSGDEEYSRSAGLSVNRCLTQWINCSTQSSSLEQSASVECFVTLCTDLGPTLDASSKDSLDEYFKGSIREAILSNDRPREVREQLLDLTVKRAANWDGAEPFLAPQRALSVEPATATSAHSITAENSQSQPPTSNQPAPVSPPTTPVQSPQYNVHLVKPSDFQCQPSTPQAQPLPSGQSPLSPVPPSSSTYPIQNSSTHYTNGPITSPVAANGPRALLTQVYPPQQNVHQSPSQVQPAFVPQGPSDRSSWNGQPIQQSAISLQEISNNSGLMPQYIQGPRYDGNQGLPQQQVPPTQEEESDGEADPYKKTLEMLEALGFPELLPNFQQHMLMDFILDSEMATIKECLTNAKIPLGAVVGIVSYLENQRKMKHTQRKPVVSRPPSSLGQHAQLSAPPQPPSMGHTSQPPFVGHIPPPPFVTYASQSPLLHSYRPNTWQRASAVPSPQQPPPAPPQLAPPMLQPQFVPPRQQSQQATVPGPLPPSVPEVAAIKLPVSEEPAAQFPGETKEPAAVSDGSEVTVRLPKVKSGQDTSKEEERTKGGFGTFTCLLCRSTTHTTMECEHRDRFFYHM